MRFPKYEIDFWKLSAQSSPPNIFVHWKQNQRNGTVVSAVPFLWWTIFLQLPWYLQFFYLTFGQHIQHDLGSDLKATDEGFAIGDDHEFLLRVPVVIEKWLLFFGQCSIQFFFAFGQGFYCPTILTVLFEGSFPPVGCCPHINLPGYASLHLHIANVLSQSICSNWGLFILCSVDSIVMSWLHHFIPFFQAQDNTTERK